MARTDFEKQDVYRLSEGLADEIWSMVSTWSRFAKWTVGKQIVKASDSIGANIAEGTGHGSFQDKRRFVRIARGSLYETKHWLRRSYRRKPLSDEQINRLKPLVDELATECLSQLDREGSARPVIRDKQPTTSHGQWVLCRVRT